MENENDAVVTENNSDDSDVSQDDATNQVENSTTGTPSTSTGDNTVNYEARFSQLEASLERILGEISSIREAQGILVENGAVITEPNVDGDFGKYDNYISPKELDLLL